MAKKILKIASHLPKQKITNENLSLRFKDWSSEKKSMRRPHKNKIQIKRE